MALREMREERALTQAQLGSLMGMDSAYLAVLEAGKKMPSLAMIMRLADGLGVPPEELVNRIARKLEDFR